jgi:BlaI family penicillinase repressor
MSKNNKPTDGELEILGVLWDKGSGTVRQVNEKLNQIRPVGYTTTLKQMQLMHEKGMLSRTKSGKTHIYQSLISQDETQANLVDKLLDTAFKGSAMKLVIQALGSHKTSKEELDEIRDFLDTLDDSSDS